MVASAAGLFPLLWAIIRREWIPATHLLLMIGVGFLIGGISELKRPPGRQRMGYAHGMVVVALSWLAIPALGTIPLWLSGHYSRWLDAYFDAMSGVTTTGLSLIQDLDHLAMSTNVWRHTLQFLGGQGIVLAALLFFTASGALSLFQAEGREERFFPSVGSTATFIWLVSLAHFTVGVLALTVNGIFSQGFTPLRSLFHAVTIFMAAFDTGGFSPQSSSIAYYHSVSFEAVVCVLMVAGAMSFGLHHALWNRRKGIHRNLEVRTILFTFTGLLGLTVFGVAAIGAFSNTGSLFRKSFFHALSAHTGTGFSTVTNMELARWSGLAFVGIATAMALGGMSSSTAGGVKSLRIGLTFRALLHTVKATLLPEKAIVPSTYYHYGRQRLHPRLAQSAMGISLLFVGLYLLGAGVGVGYGYALSDALFESVSASAAVGLSVGVVTPGMPTLLEVLMIFQMWIGRLEFVAVFAMFGFLASIAVGE